VKIGNNEIAEGPVLADEYFARRSAKDPEFRALQQLPKPHVELALNVNRLRNARGMTQEELAAAAGMKQPRIAEIERGDANPKLHTLTRLAIALGVEPWQLLVPAPALVPADAAGPADAAETVLAGR
jgi:DNA-binding XRE family transcriptional regulator